MQLQFLGANRQVTGSRYCLTVGGKKILIDCGLYQERRFLERNWDDPPFDPGSIDALLLTHAHIDHCGLTPVLVRQGFGGPIVSTDATSELLGIVWPDAARIQMEDAKYKEKRHRKEGRTGPHPIKPLFTTDEAEEALKQRVSVPYGKSTDIIDGVTAEFHDAGHILGSSMIRIAARENGHARTIVFSGDIGQYNKPIIRDPSFFTEADYVVMESTYGNRNHEVHQPIEDQLAEAIEPALRTGGNVVVPVFAIERAQELIYHLGRLSDRKRLPRVPVYLDSPMALDVTQVFRNHRECFDEETWKMIVSGQTPLRFPELRLSRSVEDSMAINRLREPAIIMATSGMCTAGRIKHHLKHNITRPESTILFVGYQAESTLGRLLVEGAQLVRIHGEMHPVRARVAQIFGLSGHADHRALLQWVDHYNQPPRRLFITHGEEQASLDLAEEIRAGKQWDVLVPKYEQTVELE